MSAWDVRHPERRKEIARRCYRKHQEKNQAYSRAYAARNKDTIRERRKLTSVVSSRGVGARATQLRGGAKKRGLEFDYEVVFSALDLAVLTGLCECCGKALTNYGEINDRPSVDRVDNTRGYVIGNVAVICYRCNVLKRDATTSELKAIISYMERHA